MRQLLGWIFGILWLGTAGAGEAPPTITVAILPVQTDGVMPGEKAEWDSLLQSVDAGPGRVLVSGQALRDRASAAGIEIAPCFEAACLNRAGTELSVDRILVVYVGRLGDRTGINVKLFDSSRGRPVGREYRPIGNDPVEIGRALVSVVQDLLDADAPEPLEQSTDADLLHAVGLAAELDGQTERALSLLRRATQAAPEDELIAFDLARVAWQGKSPRLETDAAPFLAMSPTTEDSRLLRAYVLAAIGRPRDAAQTVADVLANNPQQPEALQLRALVGSARPTKSESAREDMLRARVAMSGAHDSNVTVLPDTSPSQAAGFRAVVEGNVDGQLEQGALVWRFGGALRAAGHLNHRDVLSYYDAGSWMARMGLDWRGSSATLSVRVAHGEVFLDSFTALFLHDTGLDLEWRMETGPLTWGAFARGGYRDFALDNPETKAGAVQVGDRDGPRGTGGLLARYRIGPVHLRGRVGGQAEQAQGTAYRERGFFGQLLLGWQWARLMLSGGAAYEYRHYPDSNLDGAGEVVADEKVRLDQRVTPNVRVQLTLTDTFHLFGRYAYTRNASRQERFDYQRHVAQVGLEAGW